jgi:hypothetical protein
MDMLQDMKKYQNPEGLYESDDTSPGQQSCMGIRNSNYSSGSDQTKGSAHWSLFAAVLAGANGRSVHLLLLLQEIFIIQIR